MAPPGSNHRTAIAAGLALAAAFVWATYYFFVLDLQSRGVGVAPNVAYAFLAGGVAYLIAAWAGGHGPALREVATAPLAYGRAAMLVAMQLLVIAGTYGLGPVDTSLLTLVADTVLTPFLVLTIFREGRERLGSPAFFGGVGACTLGAALAIASGSGAQNVAGAEWAVVILLPIVIAVYFLWVARVGRTVANEPLLTHATLVAAAAIFVAAPFLPGGAGGLIRIDPVDALLLTVNGVLAFFVGPWLYFRAIRMVGMILPAILMSTIPVFTLILGVLLDRTVPPTLALVGLPVAVFGAFLAMRGERTEISAGE